MWSFMPKGHWFPFLVCCFSGSPSLLRFFVQGALQWYWYPESSLPSALDLHLPDARWFLMLSNNTWHNP